MKKIVELIALAVLTTNPYFTVAHNGETMNELYNAVIADLTKKA